jgi:hypothetical protein
MIFDNFYHSMIKNFLQNILTKNLAGKELTDEKIHDFKRLTMAQAGIIVSLFLLNFFTFLQFTYCIEIAESIFFAALGVYVYLLWDMLRNYTTNKLIVLLNFIFIMGVFTIGIIVVNPWVPMEIEGAYKLSLAGIQFCLLAVECTVIYFTLAEFFRKDLGLPMRLWGAASIYLMTGLAFGSVYEMVCILDINCLGLDIPLKTMGMMKRIEFSLMVLSGMNNPYTSAGNMIFSMGTIEALWGQLFIVLIVGRLLMK